MAIGTTYLETISNGINTFISSCSGWDTSTASHRAEGILTSIDRNIKEIKKAFVKADTLVSYTNYYNRKEEDLRSYEGALETARNTMNLLRDNEEAVAQAKYLEATEDYNYYSGLVTKTRAELTKTKTDATKIYQEIISITLRPNDIKGSGFGKMKIDYSQLNNALSTLVLTVNNASDDTNLQELITMSPKSINGTSLAFVASFLGKNLSQIITDLTSICNNISNYQGHVAETEGQTDSMGTVGAIIGWTNPSDQPWDYDIQEEPDYVSEQAAGYTSPQKEEAESPSETVSTTEPVSPSETVSQDEVYVIKPGDSLAKIAREYYGDGSRESYMKIAEANGIKNPNLINAGATLIIPAAKKAETGSPVICTIDSKDVVEDKVPENEPVEKPAEPIPQSQPEKPTAEPKPEQPKNDNDYRGSQDYSSKPYSGTGFQVTSGNKTYQLTEREMKEFYALVASEAVHNKDDALAVASVAANILEDMSYKGDTLYEIISNQNGYMNFSAYDGPNFKAFMSGKKEIPECVIKAVDDVVLHGIRNTEHNAFRSNGTVSAGNNMITSNGNRYFTTW